MSGPLLNADATTALTAWLDAVRRAGGLEPLGSETVALAKADGRIASEPITASSSSPGFDAAAMDGIAVASADTAAAPVALAADRFRRVDTGDVLPEGTDAVVRSEDVDVTDSALINSVVDSYANVRQAGEDVAAGELIVRAGQRLGPADLAVVASAGESSIRVRRRPVVAIVPTGDELVPLGTVAAPGQIVETNSLMLGALVERSGGVAAVSPIVPDAPDLLEDALGRAAAEADLVLILAGSARGADDHTPAVVDRLGEIVAHGVAVRPGHPTVLGVVRGTPVVGVPGYPVSAALAFELFAAPLLSELTRLTTHARPTATATLGKAIDSSLHSDEWVRVRLGRIGERLVALPLRRGAAVLSSLAYADGLVLVGAGSAHVPAGATVDVVLRRPLDEIEATLLAAGSTDPLLDRLGDRHVLRCDADGSGNGADSLASGLCHLALLVEEDVPPGAVRLAVRERQLGLITAAANPLALSGVGSLRDQAIRFANRPHGSSTRRVLDRMLGEHGIDPHAVTGYRREARSHAAAAAAVAAGVVDCALGTRAAAEAAGLAFVPVESQTLVLVTTAGLADDARIVALREALGTDRVTASVVGRRT
jgi:putative molybdopterin biosynthesis protein